MSGHTLRATLYVLLWCTLIGQGALVEALSSAEREAVVKIHNKLRSQLAQGKSVGAHRQPLPQAANMAKLYYDESLERSAQAAADTCTFKHTPQSSPHMFRENIAYNTADMSAEEHLIDAAKQWWDESTECSNLDVRRPLPDSNSCYLHFTAMAWAKSTRIGCGFKECPDPNYGTSKFVFCHYKKPGNIVRERVYEIGKPCSKCANGQSCDTRSGLCYETNKEGANKPPTKTKKPNNKETQNADSTKTCRCPTNSQQKQKKSSGKRRNNNKNNCQYLINRNVRQ